ncbi:MAG: peptide chain release factor-like protein [Nitrososphaera sp.]|nr:peptide chain release factor-like protein [Nitrososphaera sp.]
MWPSDVRRSDLRIEYMRGSGAGGQNRNKRDTACRILHIPTGIAVRCEEERTQAQNKALAFKRLCEKLIPLMKSAAKTVDHVKNDTVVRTYNEHRSQVKDVRLEDTFNYNKVLDGTGLEEMVKALMENDYAELLRRTGRQSEEHGGGSF